MTAALDTVTKPLNYMYNSRGLFYARNNRSGVSKGQKRSQIKRLAGSKKVKNSIYPRTKQNLTFIVRFCYNVYLSKIMLKFLKRKKII